MSSVPVRAARKGTRVVDHPVDLPAINMRDRAVTWLLSPDEGERWARFAREASQTGLRAPGR